jgi:hypothetical protein
MDDKHFFFAQFTDEYVSPKTIRISKDVSKRLRVIESLDVSKLPVSRKKVIIVNSYGNIYRSC